MTEVVITSELSGQLWNTCVWDLNSSTTLATYKGGSSSPRTMCLLAADYILTGVSNKPLIHVWTLQKREQVHLRMVCPGVVTAMCSSPDNAYIVAAVQEKIHIWQVSTGNLLAVLHRHYQCVRCLKFTDDGSHFVSAGDDNLIHVWTLWKVLEVSQSSGSHGIEPRHTWSDHSLPVTDLHVGCGGVRARVASSSLDQTCKLWELCSGQLLLNVVFDCSLTSVLLDNAESCLYAGGSDGNVYSLNLHQQPVRTEYHLSKEKEECLFKGHSKQVSSLALSQDGLTLVSGSHDHSVRLWDVYSKQCTRCLPHKGAVTNVVVVPTPPGLQNADYRPSLPIQSLKRFLYSTQQNTDQYGEDEGCVAVRITGNQDEEEDIDDCLQWFDQKVAAQEATKKENDVLSQVTNLEQDVTKLKHVNKDLYNFAVENILNK